MDINELRYSEQAKIMIENLNEKFDRKEFEKWFIDNLAIGSNNILMFLMEKEKTKSRIKI